MTDSKDTNPKDDAASTRLPLHLIPFISLFWEALALYEGRWKYNRRNWIVGKVRVSVYYSAMMRHAMRYFAGERVDEKSGVHHLGSIKACCSILLDAEENGTLIDDRHLLEGDLKFAEEMAERAEKVMKQIQSAFPPCAGPAPTTVAERRALGVKEDADII